MSTLLEDAPRGRSSLLAPPERRSAVTFSLPPAWRITLVLSAVVALLVGLSVAGQVSKYFLGHPRLKGLVPIFYVDLEANIPTWYSSLAIAACAVLLALIGLVKWRQRDRFRLNWLALAALFLLLSADEAAMLHEYPIDPLRKALGAGGLLYYPWVLPGMALVVVVGLCSWRFLTHLPARTRWCMAAAAAVFVSGAIVTEMLSGWQADRHGEETFAYAMIVTVEESCEMLGIVIFLHALVAYIHTELGGLRATIGPAADAR